MIGHLLLVAQTSCWRPPSTDPDSGVESADSTQLDSEGEPEGSAGWQSVGAEWARSCGQREDGSLECWGFGSEDKLTMKPNNYWVTAGVCTVVEDQGVCTTGSNSWSPEGQIRQLHEVSSADCTLSTGGSLTCVERAGAICDFDGASFGGSYVSFDMDAGAVCGLRDTGAIDCWSECYTLPSPAGTFSQVAVSAGTACGLGSDQSLTCWGESDWAGANGGPVTLAAGPFVDLDLGAFSVCALGKSGHVECFGNDKAGETNPPDGLFFVDIAMGDCHSCGVTADGEMVCWGMDLDVYDGAGCLLAGQEIPPQ